MSRDLTSLAMTIELLSVPTYFDYYRPSRVLIAGLKDLYPMFITIFPPALLHFISQHLCTHLRCVASRYYYLLVP